MGAGGVSRGGGLWGRMEGMESSSELSSGGTGRKPGLPGFSVLRRRILIGQGALLLFWAGCAPSWEPPHAVDPSSSTPSLESRLRQPLLRVGDYRWAHRDSVNTITFSAGGQLLVSGSEDSTISLWKFPEGTRIREFTGHDDQVNCVTLSPNGKNVVSAGQDGTVRVWDIETGRELWMPKDAGAPAWAAAYSHDGEALALTDGEEVLLYRVSTREKVARLRCGQELTSIAFSPRGNTLAAGGLEGEISVWDVPSWERRARWSSGRGAVRSLCFLPEGRNIVSGSIPGTTAIWEVESGKRLSVLGDMNGIVHAVGVSPKGTLIAIGSSDGVSVSPLQGGEPLWRRGVTGYSAKSIAFSPDGNILGAGTYAGIIEFWNAQSGERLHRNDTPGNICVLAEDGTWIATLGYLNALGKIAVRKWEVPSGRLLDLFPIDSREAIDVVARQDGGSILALTIPSRGHLSVWDTSLKREIAKVQYTFDPLNSATLSRDGKWAVLTSLGGDIQLWNTQRGGLRSIGKHDKGVLGVHFSRDGKQLATCGKDGAAILWDLDSARRIASFKTHPTRWAPAEAVACSYDGSLVALSSLFGIQIYDVETRREVASMASPVNPIVLEFSPDRRFLLGGGSDGTVGLWEIASSREVRSFPAHTRQIPRIQFSTDGRLFLTSSNDGTVAVWKTKD